MGDASLTTDLGRVLVTGGSGFVGANLVAELLDRGHQVRSFDRAPSPLPAHPRLQTVVGDICDAESVAAAVGGIDTVFHTAAIIDLMGRVSATEAYRRRSFAVNVEGIRNLVNAAQASGVQRFVYTASNSVVMGGRRIAGGDETLPYTDRFNDLYTETKVAAEKFVLGQNGCAGKDGAMLTCSIRPSGIWGRGDQTMFRKLFESVVPGRLVHAVMSVWPWLHFRFGLTQPPMEPLAVERVCIDNYFSIAKAGRDLGYRPLFTTEHAMRGCLPYYVDLFDTMKAATVRAPLAA